MLRYRLRTNRYYEVSNEEELIAKLISSTAGSNELIVCEVPSKEHIIKVVEAADGMAMTYDMRRSIMILDDKYIMFILRDANLDRYAGIEIYELYILKGGFN